MTGTEFSLARSSAARVVETMEDVKKATITAGIATKGNHNKIRSSTDDSQ
jgi:hypothetical protein